MSRRFVRGWGRFSRLRGRGSEVVGLWWEVMVRERELTGQWRRIVHQGRFTASEASRDMALYAASLRYTISLCPSHYKMFDLRGLNTSHLSFVQNRGFFPKAPFLSFPLICAIEPFEPCHHLSVHHVILLLGRPNRASYDCPLKFPTGKFQHRLPAIDSLHDTIVALTI